MNTQLPHAQQLKALIDDDLGQLIVDGVTPGPGGLVDLALTEEISIRFDAVTAKVVEVDVETATTDGDSRVSDESLKILERLFGTQQTQIFIDPFHHADESISLAPSAFLGGIYRLALLRRARVIDPLAPDSSLWGAEAAAMAQSLGLTNLAHREAASCIWSLTNLFDAWELLQSYGRARDIAEHVAHLVEAKDQESARELRASYGGAVALDQAWDLSQLTRRLALAPAGILGNDHEALRIKMDALSSSGVPERTFMLGESPRSDIVVRLEDGALVVTALLDPRARKQAVESCWARAVDPATGEVVAQAQLTATVTDDLLDERGRGVAHLSLAAAPDSEVWVEIVEDPNARVRSLAERHMSIAIRYGSAALRAARRPSAAHPQWGTAQWESQQQSYWLRSAEHWGWAGDSARSELARTYAGRPPRTELPSWATELTEDVAVSPQEPFLAEDLGVPGFNIGEES